MNIELTYYGMLAEIIGANKEELTVVGSSVGDLKQALLNKYPNLRNKDFRIAQNQELVLDSTPLNGGAIAVLPPFSGG